MYFAYNLAKIENQLKEELKDRYPDGADNDQPVIHTNFLTAGNLQSLFLEPQNDVKARKVVGILFADPNVSIAQKEVIPHLDYLHHLTGEYINFFCAGYNAYLPPKESVPDSKKIVTEVDGSPWEFSTKAFLNLEKEIESLSTWKKGDGCSLLLFTVEVSQDDVQYDFKHCLDLNLKTMLEDKAISSIRKLVDKIVEVITKNKSTCSVSNNFGMDVMEECVKKSLLALLPESVSDSYKRAEHFATRDFTKRKF